MILSLNLSADVSYGWLKGLVKGLKNEWTLVENIFVERLGISVIKFALI